MQALWLLRMVFSLLRSILLRLLRDMLFLTLVLVFLALFIAHGYILDSK